MLLSAKDLNRPAASTSLFKSSSPPSATALFTLDHTTAFVFDKKNKGWIESSKGPAAFAFDASQSCIVVKVGQGINHQVEVTSKVQDSVAANQSWVFRAVRASDRSRDVLCLQLLEKDAAVFNKTYEHHRLRCLTQLPAPASAKPEDVGADLSQGMRALSVSTMRRRLSVDGTDSKIDGHSPGARFEPVARPSPTKTSPVRPSTRGYNARHAHNLVSFSGISVKGHAPAQPDKQNQDSIIMRQLPVNEHCEGEILLAVFDGHGEQGHLVSQHFRRRVPGLLAASSALAAHPGRAMREALLTAEREIIDDVSVDTTLSGSTGVMTLLRGNKLVVANVGDSRAIFGRASENGDVVAVDISKDHKPDDDAEQARIQEAGGRVFAIKFDDGIDGPARVWLSYADMPGLAMSRSLGDTIAKEAGVVSEPDLFDVEVQADDRFYVVASDGLFEFMSSQEVVDIVAKHMRPVPDPEAAIKALVAEAHKRWRLHEPVIDDTSIIVAFFNSE